MNNYPNSGYAPQPGGMYSPIASQFQQEYHDRTLIRKYATRIGGGLLIWFFCVIAFSLVLTEVFSFYLSPTTPVEIKDLIDQSTNLISYILAFWLSTLFMMKTIKIPSNIAFPMRKPAPTIAIPAAFLTLGTSIVGITSAMLLAFFFRALLGVQPVMPDISSPTGVAANVVYFASIAIAPAIFEEAMFRGVIMQSLRRFGDGFALVISSIMFSLIHMNLVQGPNAFLLGLVIGYFVLRTGSLLTGILMHFLNNGLAVLSEYVTASMSPSQQEMVYLGTYGAYILLGVAALVFLIVRHSPLFKVAPSTSPVPSGKKYSSFFWSAPVVIMCVIMILMTIFSFERV